MDGISFLILWAGAQRVRGEILIEIDHLNVPEHTLNLDRTWGSVLGGSRVQSWTLNWIELDFGSTSWGHPFGDAYLVVLFWGMGA